MSAPQAVSQDAREFGLEVFGLDGCAEVCMEVAMVFRPDLDVEHATSRLPLDRPETCHASNHACFRFSYNGTMVLACPPD